MILQFKEYPTGKQICQEEWNHT